VRSAIDRIENAEVEIGFVIGRSNARGVVSRSPTEGGGQERDLANQYARWREQLRDRWPRTAAVRAEAQREDAEADLRNDGIW
jgi:hypothetical protein